MAKRIDDQQRVITFVMEGDLALVESALKTANAILASRRKQAAGSGMIGGVAAAKPTVVRRRRTTSETPAPVQVETAASDELAL